MNRIIDFFLPPRCVRCGIGTLTAPGLCAVCWEKIHFIDQPLCNTCGTPFEVAEKEQSVCLGCLQDKHYFRQLRSVFPYDEITKTLVLQFKHGDALHLVPLLVQWLSRAGQSLLAQNDLIIPVPLHWMRLWRRGYNQAALLAQGLCKINNKNYQPNILIRHRSTASQGSKSSDQRYHNVKGSFQIKPAHAAIIQDKNILLIDDVYASGATIHECVKILKKSGANQVDVLTLARVLIS